MLGMLEVMVVLVMLVVLEELVVFVGGIFERVKYQNFFIFISRIIESQKKMLSVI